VRRADLPAPPAREPGPIRRHAPADEGLAGLPPLGRGHVNITGDHDREDQARPDPDGFRPLAAPARARPYDRAPSMLRCRHVVPAAERRRLPMPARGGANCGAHIRHADN
jgi:hypothetical protein